MHTRLLARGESWDCDAASASSPAPKETTTESADPRRANAAHAASAAPKAKTDRPRTVTRAGGWAADSARVAPSDLRAQNEIFQAALSAERAGRDRRGRAALPTVARASARRAAVGAGARQPGGDDGRDGAEEEQRSHDHPRLCRDSAPGRDGRRPRPCRRCSNAATASSGAGECRLADDGATRRERQRRRRLLASDGGSHRRRRRGQRRGARARRALPDAARGAI